MVSYFIYLNGENEYTAVSYRPHPLYCGVYLAQTYPELTGKNDEYELAYKVLERLDRNHIPRAPDACVELEYSSTKDLEALLKSWEECLDTHQITNDRNNVVPEEYEKVWKDSDAFNRWWHKVEKNGS